jgi:cob(I)alamin adenosyltransferase
MDKEVDFERLLTYKIEYSDAIVNFENSQEEYVNAFSHLNKINSIVKIDGTIESFKNSLNLAKTDYDNKLNKLGNAKDWLNNLENKIFKMENKILLGNHTSREH